METTIKNKTCFSKFKVHFEIFIFHLIRSLINAISIQHVPIHWVIIVIKNQTSAISIQHVPIHYVIIVIKIQISIN